MIGAMFNAGSDAIEAVMRFMGRRTGETPLPYENPAQMIGALNNPDTEEAAVSTMHRMHYGAFYNKKSRGNFSWLAERELLRKGKGRSGAIFGRPVKGASLGLAHLKSASYFLPISAAFEASMAPKGHKLAGLVKGIAAPLAFAAGDAVGTLLAGPVAGFALGMVTEKIGSEIGEGFDALGDIGRSIRHVNMGGNYEDSKIAYTLRQRAAIELGSSSLNARKWLGAEAILMHQ